jgi:hypothetical protein
MSLLEASLNEVFCTDGMKYLIPACPPPILSGQVAVGGSLFHWLYEYLRRLETGVYVVQPINLSHPENVPSPAAGNFQGISLFPMLPQDEEDFAGSEHADDGVSNFQKYASSASVTVTNGIEVSASCVFVPHASTRR